MRNRWYSLIFLFVLAGVSCGGGASTEAPADDPPATTTTEAEPEPEPEPESEGVQLGESELGEILVGPDKLTLYVFTADTEGTSTCYDACAELWPPVPGEVSVGSDLDQSMFGTTTRDDGSSQLTVNGMPLYWYTPDTEPGDTMGQGFNDVWFVVAPDGTMIKPASASSNDSPTDYGEGGYDY